MGVKKSLSILLALVLFVCTVSATANAATVSPQYTNISYVTNDLEASGRTLYVTAGTYGYFDVDSCKVTATLQKLSGSSWSNYKVWSATSPSSHLDYVVIDTSISVSAGTYRLVSSHSVTLGASTEYESVTSNTVTVS